MIGGNANPEGPLCPLCQQMPVIDGSCPACYAPREIISSIRSRDDKPKFTAILGPSNVGKTVYLGMLLELLSRGVGGMHGVPRGAFSLNVHRNVILSLEKQRFPDKTPNEPDRWHWVHCEVSMTRNKKTRHFDVVSPDVAGEAVQSELEIPESKPTVRALIQQCSGLVALIDIEEVTNNERSAEIFAMQLITYLITLRPPKKHRKLDIPVALVFTKADRSYEAIRDPNAFARANVQALWRLCENRLTHFQFFASGVAGSIGWLVDRDNRYNMIPLRVEPRGIFEPFAWLFSHYR